MISPRRGHFSALRWGREGGPDARDGEPAAARSAERVALERREFCRLLGEAEGDVSCAASTFSSTARQQRLDGTNNNAEEEQKEAKQAAGRRRAAAGRRCTRARATRAAGTAAAARCGVDDGRLAGARRAASSGGYGLRAGGGCCCGSRRARGSARVSRCGLDSAGEWRRRQPQGHAQGPGPGQEQQLAAAPAMAELLEAQVVLVAHTELNEHEDQQAEPRVAVAAEPHKRRAVSAATAVGAVGVTSGKQPASDKSARKK
eukprot:6069843-Prymnesium_polylepis.2